MPQLCEWYRDIFILTASLKATMVTNLNNNVGITYMQSDAHSVRCGGLHLQHFHKHSFTSLTCADCLPQRTTETLCWYKPVWSHPSASIVSSVAVRLLRYPSISWGPRTHISPWLPAAHSVPVSTSISCQQQKQRHTITQTRVNALLKSLCCVEDSPWWVVPVHTLLNSLHCIEDSPWWSYICTPWVIKTCHSIFLHNFDKWWHIFKILSLWTEQ